MNIEMNTRTEQLETISSLSIPFMIPGLHTATIFAAFNGPIKKIVQIRPADSKQLLHSFCSCDGIRQIPGMLNNREKDAKDYMILVTLENINCDHTPPHSVSPLREIGPPEGGCAQSDLYIYYTHFFTTLDERDTVYITIIVQVGVDVE